MCNKNYNFCSDINEVKNKIYSLEKELYAELGTIQSLTYIDLFYFAVCDKYLKLMDPFIYSVDTQNITVLAALTRISLDCCLRGLAPTLVNDSDDLCDKVLKNELIFRKHTSQEGKMLTDKYLCEKLGALLNLPIYELYQKVSGYIHFSSSSFHNIARTEGDSKISMLISRKNNSVDAEAYAHLTLELSNHFYYFGKILIKVILHSWLQQKKDEESQ